MHTDNDRNSISVISLVLDTDSLNFLLQFQKKRNTLCLNLSPTVNFLNIRTPKLFVVITLKFELCGSTTE